MSVMYLLYLDLYMVWDTAHSDCNRLSYLGEA